MTERLELKASIAVDEAGEITGIAWPFGTPDRVGDLIEERLHDRSQCERCFVFRDHVAHLDLGSARAMEVSRQAVPDCRNPDRVKVRTGAKAFMMLRQFDRVV